MLIHVHPQITNAEFCADQPLTQAEWPASFISRVLTVLMMLVSFGCRKLSSKKKKNPQL